MNTATAWLLALVLQGDGTEQASQPGPPASPPGGDAAVALRVDGEPVTRAAYSSWLVETRGPDLAPDFVALLRLRRMAREAGIELPAGECRARAEAEQRARVDAAFGGDPELLATELSREGRTPLGRLVEREQAIEAELLFERVAERREVTAAALRAELRRPFEAPGLEGRPPPAGDAPCLVVDGAPVSTREFAAWLLRHRGEHFARRYGEEQRIRAAARAAGVRASSEEVRARAERARELEIERVFGGDRDAWARARARTARTEDQTRGAELHRAELDVLVGGLVLRDRTVAPGEVRNEWQRRYGKDGRRVELRWIRLDADVPGPTPGEDQEAYDARREAAVAETVEKAAELRRRIVAGEDFATLAERHSVDEGTRGRGGRPGDDFRLHHLPHELRFGVMGLAPGEVSPPLTLGISVFVFEVTAVRETPFETVRDELAASLRGRVVDDAELAERRNRLVQDLQVELLPELFP